jgi:hypothetical protein
MSASSENLASYEQQLLTLENHIVLNDRSNKHAVVLQMKKNFIIMSEIIDGYLQRINDCVGDSDFVIIVLIRILYLIKESEFPNETLRLQYRDLVQKIVKVFNDFPFWPPKQADPQDSRKKKNIDNIIFWSENHLLMILGSSYLFTQYLWKEKHAAAASQSLEGASLASAIPPDLTEVESAIEFRLLSKYLDVHCHDLFAGVYEVNSHVYLPYSLNALWNIYDFSLNEELRQKAEKLIDIIVFQLMLGTDPSNGIGNLIGEDGSAMFCLCSSLLTSSCLPSFLFFLPDLIS